MPAAAEVQAGQDPDPEDQAAVEQELQAHQELQAQTTSAEAEAAKTARVEMVL